MIISSICLIVIGFFIRFLALRELKKAMNVNLFWRIVTPKKIIETGIYKHIRHPMYLGGIFHYFGFALLFTRHLGFAIMFIVLLLDFILDRLDREEQFLIDIYGQEYIDYMKETKTLVPYLF